MLKSIASCMQCWLANLKSVAESKTEHVSKHGIELLIGAEVSKSGHADYS